MNRLIFFIPAFLLLGLPSPSGAADGTAPDCVKAYETAIHGTWQIASDVLRFKTMFDNYDALCSQHYPDEMSALQGSVEKLRASTDIDAKNAEKVVRIVFDDVLPDRVDPACAKNKTARERVRKNVTKAMKTQTKTISARLEKSALSMPDPGAGVKICRDLKPLEKKVRKAIGDDFKNPLFEMSLANSKFMTRDEKKRRDDFALYRSVLDSLEKPAD